MLTGSNDTINVCHLCICEQDSTEGNKVALHWYVNYRWVTKSSDFPIYILSKPFSMVILNKAGEKKCSIHLCGKYVTSKSYSHKIL